MNLNEESKSYIQMCNICSLAAGVFFLLWAISVFFLPIDVLNPVMNASFFKKIGQNKFMFILNQLLFVFGSLSMVGIVLCFFYLYQMV